MSKSDKEIYQRFRSLSFQELWQEEVPRYDQASERKRFEQVGLIRALGVATSESAGVDDKQAVKAWLIRLLNDPQEKIRRYAMTALPKIGANEQDEAVLLELLKTTELEREKKFLSQTLDKIGGKATLEVLKQESLLPSRTLQKVSAAVARSEQPSQVRMDGLFSELEAFPSLLIRLRCRQGLEPFVTDELKSDPSTKDRFKLEKAEKGEVLLRPLKPFSLGHLYRSRCFKSVGLVLSTPKQVISNNSLAKVIATPLNLSLMQSFTNGPLRYRLEFVGKGAQRGAVRDVVNQAFEQQPGILNDSRQATWSIDVYPGSVELRPRLSPDPRFAYRLADVPAASHPPFAAAMARLADLQRDEYVWDPFCGSGQELIECALLGKERIAHLYGTDLSPEAVEITRGNMAAAGLDSLKATLACCDFRDFNKASGLNLRPESLSLIISNPPLGKRVHVGDLKPLIQSLLQAAAIALKPGGRLVFANPLKVDLPHPGLKLESRQLVDLGILMARLELYRKL